MGQPFASSKRPVARAKEHIDNIDGGIRRFFESVPYARVIERNLQGFEEHKIRLTKPLPDDLPDLTLEAIEGLRAALDHAAYATALACDAKRPEIVHFPVADTAADFETVLKGRLKNLPPDIVTLFRGFQTYKGGNNLIWALNRIRREAAHRLIRNIEITRPVPLTVPVLRWNSEKNEIIFAVTAPGSDLQYNVEFTFFVAFGPVEGVAGEPLIETLADAFAHFKYGPNFARDNCRGSAFHAAAAPASYHTARGRKEPATREA